jgi:hypothetical protein
MIETFAGFPCSFEGVGQVSQSIKGALVVDAPG